MVPSLVHLNAQLAVAGQIGPEDVAEIANLGFRAIVNNRPDGEGGPMQPASAAVEAAAKAAGLKYLYFPVGSGVAAGPQQLSDFAGRLRELPSPILAYCRTGTRSTALLRAVGAV